MRSHLPLFVALLVLLQSGLAAGHCRDAHLGEILGTPHVHLHDLLDWAQSEPASNHEDEGDSHDEWPTDTVYLPALTSSLSTAPSPLADLISFPACELVSFHFPDCTANSLGLPPPTAGPSRSLVLLHCSLRN